jgi:geranylgeranyl diphosphate synthase type I
MNTKTLKSQTLDDEDKSSQVAGLCAAMRSAAFKVDELIGSMLDGSPKRLYCASAHYLKSGGKRLRPFLLIKSCELLGGGGEEALPVAAAIEMVHNFTLIHDDLIDDDESRHNVPTVHRHYGMPLAVLCGDLLIVKAFECITTHGGKAGLPDDLIVELISRLTKSCLQVSEGQALDIAMTSNGKSFSESQYIEMIGKKTGALFETSCELGALCARAGKKEFDRVATYGRNLGIAFQLIDDLIGVVGDPSVARKPVGNDIKEGKKTLPIQLAMRKAKEGKKEKLLRVLGRKDASDAELKEALGVLSDVGVERDVRDRARCFAVKAVEAIEPFAESGPKQLLRSMADFVVERTF